MSNRVAASSLLGLLLCAGGRSASGQAKDVVQYVELDALGTIRVVTDDKGRVIERHDYLPFGEECTAGPCASNPGVGAGQPRKFTGKERDAETGLDYFGARYYGSRMGRFTTTDPAYTIQENLIDPQRWNRYAYGRNNPLRYFDPDGRAVVEIPQATLDRNSAIRAAVADSLGGGHPHAQFGRRVVDVLLSTALPQDANEYAANAEATLFGLAAPLEAGPRVLANRLAGKAAEAKVAEELVAEGKTILGSQVCCKTSLGRRFMDFLTREGEEALTQIEVKSGNATRTPLQRAKDAEIAAGKGTFAGKNAPTELRGQQRAVETVERRE